MGKASELIDLTGKVFGKLVVIKQVPRNGRASGSWWLVACECGREVEKCGAELRRGGVKSCGRCKATTDGTCPVCGEPVGASRSKKAKVYCSPKCWKAGNPKSRPAETKACLVCREEFQTTRSNVLYCGVRCARRARGRQKRQSLAACYVRYRLTMNTPQGAKDVFPRMVRAYRSYITLLRAKRAAATELVTA